MGKLFGNISCTKASELKSLWNWKLESMTAARGQRTNYGVYFHISIVVGFAPTTDNCSSEPRTDPAERHTLTRALRWKHENDSIRARLPLCTELLCYVQAGGRRCAAHSVLCSGQAVQTFCQYFFCNFATMIQPQVPKGNSQEISFFCIWFHGLFH